MHNLVKSVKASGGRGVGGVFVPQDPGGADEMAKRGQMAFDFGAFFTKVQRMGTGQANVKAYNRRLMRLIEQGRAKPSFIISHALQLDKAPVGYQNFDERKDGWTMVALKTGA